MKLLRIQLTNPTASDNEFNLVPFLNLFTVLIPFLLTSVVFIQIEFLHLFLPVEPSGETLSDLGAEPRRSLSLIIRISEDTFSLEASRDIPAFSPIRRTHREQLVPDSLTEYQIKLLPDYSTLIDRLAEVKKRYAKEDEVIIMAKDHISYPTLIAVMDCARYENRFPTISFSRWER